MTRSRFKFNITKNIFEKYVYIPTYDLTTNKIQYIAKYYTQRLITTCMHVLMEYTNRLKSKYLKKKKKKYVY